MPCLEAERANGNEEFFSSKSVELSDSEVPEIDYFECFTNITKVTYTI